ncbi:hypothetical protein KKG36_01390 [Patescibacteria group bacterium]|nr:hypothetical protein [Patescibacteria group bacterium]
MANLSALQDAIGYTFTNRDLLIEALTHANEGRKSNGALAFLGSAAAQFVLAKELFTHHLDTPGKMSKMRDGVCTKSALAEIASSLNIKRHISVPDGLRSEGVYNAGFQTALETAVQALMGAILLDGGYFAFEEFAKKFLFARISGEVVKDPKSQLQEIMQAKMGITPRYELIGTTGPMNNLVFTVGVYSSNQLLAQGEGPTKKEAEKVAAQKAVQELTK